MAISNTSGISRTVTFPSTYPGSFPGGEYKSQSIEPRGKDYIPPNDWYEGVRSITSNVDKLTQEATFDVDKVSALDPIDAPLKDPFNDPSIIDSTDDLKNKDYSLPLSEEEYDDNEVDAVAKSVDKQTDVIQAGLDRAKQREDFAAGARATAGILRATGGIINANAKYTHLVGQNNFNIASAQQQANIVASNAKYNILREQTKGKERGNAAMMNAVAQGQSATGDLAKTAISNEDVYAAQNSMNMEINAMRQVFGLETHERMLQSDINMAGIDRDAEINQHILGGISDMGMAGIQTGLK